MKQFIAVGCLALGATFLMLSFVIPAIATANTDIISGADWGTFLFHFREIGWMRIVGVVCLCFGLLSYRKGW